MLDLRRLKLLTEIARRGSISAAAEAARFTQPAVSRQIARLEAEVGTELLRRTSHGVQLTEAGELLAEHAIAILARVERAEHEMQELLRARGQRIRLGFFPTAAVIVHNAVLAMRVRMPEVTITVLEGEPADLHGRLASGTLDMALAFADEVHACDGDDICERLPLFEDHMWLALPAEHPLALQEPLALRDLQHEPWGMGASPDHPCSVLLSRAFAHLGGEPRVAFESNDYAAVQELVAAGVGLALVPELAADHDRDDITFRRLADPPLSRRVELAIARRPRCPPAHDALVEVLRSLTTPRNDAQVQGAPDTDS